MPLARLAAYQSGREAEVSAVEKEIRAKLDELEAHARGLMSPRSKLTTMTSDDIPRLPVDLRPGEWPVIGYSTRSGLSPPAAFCWTASSYQGGPVMVQVHGQLDGATQATIICELAPGTDVEISEERIVDSPVNDPSPNAFSSICRRRMLISFLFKQLSMDRMGRRPTRQRSQSALREINSGILRG